MAQQYQVPQDVEAEDKLLGPFTFRQFIYLLVGAALIAVAVLLFRIFPLLAIIPVPLILLFGALALPIKKEQPMETYLAAIISFRLKPRIRLWKPGQPETDILITAPKKVDAVHTKQLSENEATHRLSFLADIVDSEGYAIKGATVNSSVRDEVLNEASSAVDIFDPITTAPKAKNSKNQINNWSEYVANKRQQAYRAPAIPNSTQNTTQSHNAPAIINNETKAQSPNRQTPTTQNNDGEVFISLR